MSITKTELKNILNESEDYEALRSRVEKLAETSQDKKKKREFVGMITRLNTALAEAAGKKPLQIDPAVTRYYEHGDDDGLVYRVGGYYVAVGAFLKYPETASITVFKSRWGVELASFRVTPLSPEGAVALTVACINHLNDQKPEKPE